MEAANELHSAYDQRGNSRVEVFLRSLGSECQARAIEALDRLAEYGLDLSANPKVCKRLKGKHHHIWELRKMCPQGAIRFYFFQTGENRFQIACAELKRSSQPSKAILDIALEAYEEWQSSLN